MKDFCMKHPIITFLIVDGVFELVKYVVGAFAMRNNRGEEECDEQYEDEFEEDEPYGITHDTL